MGERQASRHRIVLDELGRDGWSVGQLEGDAELTASLASFGGLFGRPDRGRGSKSVQLLRPLSRLQAAPRSLSAVVGTDLQPWHTDLAHRQIPARFVLIACIEPGEVPVATEILDSRQALDSALESAAKSEPFLVRAGRSAFYSTVCDERVNRVRLDPICMSATTSEGERLRDTIAANVPTVAVTLARGQFLLFDNWRVFHRRQDAGASPGRVLARLYISGED